MDARYVGVGPPDFVEGTQVGREDPRSRLVRRAALVLAVLAGLGGLPPPMPMRLRGPYRPSSP